MDIRMSSYAFELLLAFLHDARLMLVMKVINFRLNIRIYEQVPVRLSSHSVECPQSTRRVPEEYRTGPRHPFPPSTSRFPSAVEHPRVLPLPPGSLFAHSTRVTGETDGRA